MRYKAVHSTRYLYDAVVSQCQSEVRLTPRALPWQSLIESRIQATPAPAAVETHKDYFGNDVTTFTILESHDRFVIVGTSVVEVRARPAAARDLPWEAVRDELAAHARPETLEAFEFVFDSPFIAAAAELGAYAATSFPAGRPLLEAVDHLAHRIHTDFAYDPVATDVATPVDDVLRGRRGVCQDFAHVMLACLRGFGLAARYVSGYLVTRPDGGPRLVGTDASHAWLAP